MNRRAKLVAIAAAAGAVAVTGGVATADAWHRSGERGNGWYHHRAEIKHVLLISVDGMHQSDLNWYIANHPNSELAQLAGRGAEYTNAHTSDPSDSDPGGTAIMTGGDPGVTTTTSSTAMPSTRPVLRAPPANRRPAAT